ncbi:hypothetical protein ABVT39_019336 [Epinephelus coioides]
MGPLTTPHDCDSCLHKSQKIMELEWCISNLYWIRNEESLLDFVVAIGPPGNPADLDSTLLEHDAATTAISRLASSAPAPHLPAEDSWLLLGARPKWANRSAKATFTFSPNPRLRANSCSPNQESWSTVSGKGLERSSPIPYPPCELQLENSKRMKLSRMLNNLSAEKFSTAFDSVVQPFSIEVDVDTQALTLKSHCSAILDEIAPLKPRTIPAANPTPWLNDDIHGLSRKCRRAERL